MMFKGTNTGYALFIYLFFFCSFFFLLNVLFHFIQHPWIASFNGSHTFTQMTPAEDAFPAELRRYKSTSRTVLQN